MKIDKDKGSVNQHTVEEERKSTILGIENGTLSQTVRSLSDQTI